MVTKSQLTALCSVASKVIQIENGLVEFECQLNPDYAVSLEDGKLHLVSENLGLVEEDISYEDALSYLREME